MSLPGIPPLTVALLVLDLDLSRGMDPLSEPPVRPFFPFPTCLVGDGWGSTGKGGNGKACFCFNSRIDLGMVTEELKRLVVV